VHSCRRGALTSPAPDCVASASLGRRRRRHKRRAASFPSWPKAKEGVRGMAAEVRVSLWFSSGALRCKWRYPKTHEMRFYGACVRAQGRKADGTGDGAAPPVSIEGYGRRSRMSSLLELPNGRGGSSCTSPTFISTPRRTHAHSHQSLERAPLTSPSPPLSRMCGRRRRAQWRRTRTAAR